MSQRKILLVIIAFFVLVLTACSDKSASKDEGAATDGGTFVIKAGHAAGVDHFGQKTFEKFKEIVETNSNGKIQVEIYPAGELGGEREMLEMLLMGEITMMAPSSSPLDAVTKYMAAWDLPYLFKDTETAYKVLDGEIGQFVLDSMSDKGIVGLAYWENGFRHLTNNVRSVSSVKDMTGLKMRTLENPMQIKAWTLAGADAAPLGFTLVHDALKTGQFNAQETPLSLIYSSKFYEVQKYLTLTGHMYGPWPVVLNKEFFDSLPEDLQQVVREAAIEARDYNRALSKEDEQKSLELLQQKGMEVTVLTDAQKQEFKQAMNPIYEDVRKDVGDDFFNKLMQVVE